MNRLAPFAMLFVVALAVGGFLACFEPVEEVVDVGYDGAARANPYLAFERLLTRLGAPAETRWGDAELPSGDHTLVLVGPEPLPANVGLDELLDWVADGGQLVATPAETRTADVLLARFGLALAEADGEADPEVDREAGDDGEGAAGDDLEPEGVESLAEMLALLGDGLDKTTVEIPWVGVPFEALMPPQRFVAGEPRDERIEVDVATGTLHLTTFGAGSVWFVADDRFLTNPLIGRLDHARLAWELIEWTDDEGAHRGGVTLLVRHSPPGLLALLWRHAWPLAVSAALLLAALLAAVSARFGPRRRPPPEQRRRLLEHVEASGAFLWHQGRGDELLASARAALLRRLERREPAWAKLPPSDLVARLAAHAGVEPRRLDAALHAPPAAGRPDPAAFTAAVATLETVRRTL